VVTFWNTLYMGVESSDYLLLLALVFTATVLAVGAGSLVLLRRDPVRERLSRLTSAPAAPSVLPRKAVLVEEDSAGFVTKVVAPLHRIAAPSDASEQKKIRLLLTQAGLRSPGAYRAYLGSKVFLGLLFPACYLFGSFFLTLSSKVLLIALFLGGFGFLFPTWVVHFLAKQRQQAIGRALPDALDLMVVCAEAGLGLDMTLKRVGEEIRPLSEQLSDELHLTNLEVKSGKPRNESLKNMGVRTGVREVSDLMTVLTQASRFGTGIAQALRLHAEAMRVRRKQLAEEKAGKLMVKLMLPLVLFIFPALFVVLLGPAGIRIAKILPMLGGG
jgi:tight adherence protein C